MGFLKRQSQKKPIIGPKELLYEMQHLNSEREEKPGFGLN